VSKITSFIAKTLGAVPKEEREGISMGFVAAWEVSVVKNLSDFLRGLPNLLPEGSILYLEGTEARDAITFLKRNSAKQTCKVAIGTIWPRPQFFHILISTATMSELSRISDKYVQPEICTHLHAYKDGQVLLEWHDAFSQEFRISKDIPEQKVAEFCKLLNATYKEAIYSQKLHA
jgi:hypothetical protein